jgi:hypothetical protein
MLDNSVTSIKKQAEPQVTQLTRLGGRDDDL